MIWIKEGPLKKFLFLSAAFCLLPVISALAVGEFEVLTPVAETTPVQAAPPPALSGQSLYLFHEHLFAAEALTFLEEGKEVPGKWQQNHFAFSKLDPKAKIRLVTTPGTRGGAIIEFEPLPKMTQRLTFYDVIPGNKLVIHYRLEQQEKTKENNYMTFTIWAGRHRVKRLRLAPATKEVWQKEILDFKAASFLNKNIPIIFEIKTDSSVPLVFKFFGEIKR